MMLIFFQNLNVIQPSNSVLPVCSSAPNSTQIILPISLILGVVQRRYMVDPLCLRNYVSPNVPDPSTNLLLKKSISTYMF